MVGAEDVVHIVQSLAANNIRAWLTGGWGIDALLREQARPHKDLDILVRVDDVAALRDHLGRAGYDLHELWTENRWLTDAQGNEVPTAFVLQDAEGRQVDVHAMYLDEQGHGTPAWADEELVLKKQDLTGEGQVAGIAVRCISPEAQLRFHTGYDLPPEQARDVERLKGWVSSRHPIG